MSPKPRIDREDQAGLLDRFDEKLRELGATFEQYHRQSARIPVALAEGAVTLDRRRFAPVYDDLDATFPTLEEMRRVWAETDAARKDAEPFPQNGPLAERAQELLDYYKALVAGWQLSEVQQTWAVNLASITAMEIDPSGGETNTAIKRIYGLNPSRRYKGDPSPELRLDGLFPLTCGITNHPETYYGKPRHYYTVALKNESYRHHRDREIEERDFLSMTPKESKDLSEEDRDLRRQMNASAVGVEVGEPHPGEIADSGVGVSALDSESAVASPFPDPEESAIQGEIEKEQRAEIEILLNFVPDHLRELLVLRLGGMGATEACQRLGLSSSDDSNLRNWIARFRRQREAG